MFKQIRPLSHGVLTSSSVKIAAFTAAIFLGLGVYLPFFPRWLQSEGYGATDIATLLAIPLITKVVFTPLVTAHAGRVADRRYAVIVYAGICLLSFAALSLSDGFITRALCLAVHGIFWHSLIPLSDAFALREVRRAGANYGTIRLWGSVAFVVANLSAGYALSSIGGLGIYSLILCLSLVAFAAAFLLPAYPSSNEPSKNGRDGAVARVPKRLFSDLGLFLSDSRFLTVALSSATIQASHALLYGFGTIYWLEKGYSTAEIGMFWAIGVISEILLFTQARVLFEKVGPIILLALGGCAAVLRWAFHSDIDGFWFILLWQMLHGLTFGCTHLGLQAFIADYVGDEKTPAAQGAMAFVNGVMIAALTLICGWLYGQYGSAAFPAMAVVAAIGTTVLVIPRLSPKIG